MIEKLKKEIERIRMQRKHMLTKAAAVFIAVTVVSMYLLSFSPSILGLAVYDTTEQTVDVSSTQGHLSFAELPDFSMSVGTKFKYQIENIQGPGEFYDDTRLFNITQEGVIEFVPAEKDIGKYNVWIIYKNGQEYHYQNVVFEIKK